MNPVALYCASGDSFYLGAFLLVSAIIIPPHWKHPWIALSKNAASWIALAMMVMACPPFSFSVDLTLFAAFSVWFLTSNVAKPSRMWPRLRVAAASVLLILLLALSASELWHSRMPVIKGMPSGHLTVIGDSISSGIDTRSPAWPTVLGQMTGIPIKNLSRPGASTAEGEAMAAGVITEDRLVVIELGGNDLLSGVPSVEFEHNLGLLLAKLIAPGRTVVMFELPLLPNRIAYGRIQRRLASKYGVRLIPKRYFAYVLAGADATVDGLHLSQMGAQKMASLVAEVLSLTVKSSVLPR
jgi:acyl-CoA thioesterase I